MKNLSLIIQITVIIFIACLTLDAEDIDECEQADILCPDNSDCINTEGSFRCNCADGYLMYQELCVPAERCVDQNSFPYCVCDEGFERDGYSGQCVDVDECFADSNACGEDGEMTCENLDGGFECKCGEGFTKITDPVTACVDFDECSAAATEGTELCAGEVNTKCLNIKGTYECTCSDGYAKDETTGGQCTNVDECTSAAEDTPDCGTNTVCVDTQGSYTCECADPCGMQMETSPSGVVTCSWITTLEKKTVDCDQYYCTDQLLDSYYECTVYKHAPANQGMWINEFHYQNKDTDANEVIEIMWTPHADITGIKVIFYDGTTGLMYDCITERAATTNEKGVYAFPKLGQGSLRNGKHGLALLDADDTVIQFISYGGSFTANDGPAKDLVSVDILVAESASVLKTTSAQLHGTGNSYADFEWRVNIPQNLNDWNQDQALTCSPVTLSYKNAAQRQEMIDKCGLTQAQIEEGIYCSKPKCVLENVEIKIPSIQNAEFRVVDPGDRLYLEWRQGDAACTWSIAEEMEFRYGLHTFTPNTPCDGVNLKVGQKLDTMYINTDTTNKWLFNYITGTISGVDSTVVDGGKQWYAVTGTWAEFDPIQTEARCVLP